MRGCSILIVVTLILAGFLGSIDHGGSGDYISHQDPTTNVDGIDINEGKIAFNLSFAEPVIIESRDEGYCRIIIEGLDSLDTPGLPLLPFKSLNVLLPCGEELMDIEVLTGTKTTLEGRYLIEPGEIPVHSEAPETSKAKYDSPLDYPSETNIKEHKTHDLRKDGNSLTSDEHRGRHETPGIPSSKTPFTDKSVYNSDEKYPGKLYSKVFTQQFRGYRILVLRLYPIQYIPKTGKIIHCEEMNVIITTKSIKNREVKLLRNSPEDEAKVQELVDNPWAVDTYKMKRGTRYLVDPSYTFKYVIITNDALNSSFQPLIDWKNSKGLSATTVTMENIVNDPDYNGIDTQEEIRNFIIDAYTNWETEYVLLGGDDEIIPHRGVYGSVHDTEDLDIACDLYYAGLDGNWDNDNDGIYGEGDSALGGNGTLGEEADFLAEVYIGRAPVNSPGEVTNFVSKVISYEQTPLSLPYLNNSLMLGAKADEVTDGGITCDQLAEYLPDSYKVTKLYERDHTASVPATTSELNSGRHIVNHIGHADTSAIGLAYVDYPEFYQISDVDGLTNTKYFLLYSVGCYSSSFDNRLPDGTKGSDAIAEHFVFSEHGAFAYIGNTRYGIYHSGQPGYGPLERYNKKFFESLFDQKILNIGKALQDSKEELIGDVGAVGQMRWVHFTLCLLGDPETPYLLTSLPPMDLEVISIDTHSEDEIYSTGRNYINSTIRNNGIYAEKNFNVSLEIREIVSSEFDKTYFSDDMEGYSHPGRGGKKLVEYNRVPGQWENGAPSNTYGPVSAHSGTNCWGTNMDGDYGSLGKTTFAGVLEDQGLFVDVYGRNDFLDIPAQEGDNIYINLSWSTGADIDLYLYKPSDVLNHQTTGFNHIASGISASSVYEDLNYTVQPGDGDGIFQVRVELFSGGDTSYIIEESTVDGVTYTGTDYPYSLKRVDNEGSGYEYPERCYHYVYVPYDPSHVFYVWYSFEHDVDFTLYDADGDVVLSNTLDNDGYWWGTYYADEPGLWKIRLIGEGPDNVLDEYTVNIEHPKLFTTFQLPSFDLSNPKIEFVNLSFWQWYDMEEEYDFGYVFVSPYGGLWWYYLASYTGNNSAVGWEYEELSLIDFVGYSDVVVMFAFASDTLVNKPGWYIDDIVIKGTVLPTEMKVYGPENQTVSAELLPGNDMPLSWEYNFVEEGWYKIIIRTHLPHDKNNSNDVKFTKIFTNYPPETPIVHSASHPDESVWYQNNDPIISWTTASKYTYYACVETDETVISGYSDMNFDNTTYGGGAYVGFDASYGYGAERSYFKFDLSSIPFDRTIVSGKLYIYLYSEIHSGDQPIGVYFCSNDGWDNLTITWDNAPSIGGTPTDTNDGPFEPHNWFSWDITSDFKNELAGDQTLTEVLRDVVEGADTWKCFVEKEYEPMLGAIIKYAYTTIEPSEVVGYSYLLDNEPSTMPDTIVDGNVNSTSYTDLSDDVWYFHVRACDNIGNWSEAAHYKISIDTTQPTSSVNALSVYQNSDIFDIGYTAADGSGSGINKISLWYRKDGGEWRLYGNFTSSPISFHSNLTGGNGNYEFYTIAWDNAGNVEAGSGTADTTTFLDTDLPSSDIIPLQTYQTSKVFDIHFTADDGEGSGIKYVELFYTTNNGVTWTKYGTSFIESPVQFNSSLEGGDGTYGFYTVATDNAGNVELHGVPSTGTPPNESTIVDTTNPTSHVNPLPKYTAVNLFIITANATDINGISEVELWYKKDSGSWVRYNNKTTSPWSWNFNTSETGDGLYSFYTRSYDSPSNYENPPQANDTWTLVDIAKPILDIISPINGSTITLSSLTVTWSGYDSTSGIDRYEIKIDEGDYLNIGMQTNYTFEDLNDGGHTITIRVTDRAGNFEEKNLHFDVNTSPSGPTEPFQNLLIYLLISVIIAVVVLAVLLMKRKKKPDEVAEEEFVDFTLSTPKGSQTSAEPKIPILPPGGLPPPPPPPPPEELPPPPDS